MLALWQAAQTATRLSELIRPDVRFGSLADKPFGLRANECPLLPPKADINAGVGLIVRLVPIADMTN